jgi:hypothetical protein
MVATGRSADILRAAGEDTMLTARPCELTWEEHERFSHAPDDLERQVRDALLHLHDAVYLQTHPLAKSIGHGLESCGTNLGKSLQQALVNAVGTFRPEKGRGDRRERSFQLLWLRYVEALPVIEVQERLNIASSEYHRIHRRALQAVVSLLADRMGIDLNRPSTLSEAPDLPAFATHLAPSRDEGF